MTAAGRRRSWPAIAGLVLAALLFAALGDWQVHRLAWKQALIARVAQATSAPPQAFAVVAGPDFEYHRVLLNGHYEPASTVLVTATTDLGSGYWDMVVLARNTSNPVRFNPPPPGEDFGSAQSTVGNDARAVWINRGFVPTGSRRAGVAAGTPTGPVTIIGLIRLTEPHGTWPRANRPDADRWYSRDLAAMAQARHLGRGLPGVFVDVQDESPHEAGGAPVPGLTVLTFPNNHFGYAMTWFALALMSAGGAIVLWRRPS